MTAPDLFPPPAVYSLPVSLGADIQVTFRNMTPDTDPPVYVDYPPGVTVSLVIGKAGATVASADGVINGSDAVCEIPFATADTLRAGTPWRCVVTIPDGSGGVDSVVAINGPLVRCDGI
jgi:hypothetical protein